MVLWSDEDAPVDGQAGRDADLAVVEHRLFAVRLDLGQHELLVLQAQLVGRVVLDRLGRRTHRLPQSAVRVVGAVHSENY